MASRKSIIVSADEIKKKLPGYSPSKSHKVHKQSAKLADQDYYKHVESSDYEKVILMSGGSASGKTEFLSEYLVDQPAIIYDSTSPSFEGIRIKSKAAIKNSKSVEVVAVWPDNLKISYAAFLERDRKYPDTYFFQTHSSSRQALLEAAESDSEITIKLFISKYDTQEQRLKFSRLELTTSEQIEYLQQNQYTEDEIKAKIGL